MGNLPFTIHLLEMHHNVFVCIAAHFLAIFIACKFTFGLYSDLALN